jgi:hypothetical protein
MIKYYYVIEIRKEGLILVIFSLSDVRWCHSGLRLVVSCVHRRIVLFNVPSFVSSLAFPLRTTMAHLTGRDTRTSQTAVSGSDNGNAHLSVDIATHDRVRLLPLFSQERG